MNSFVKIMFIVAIWGTLFGLILTFGAVAHPAITAEQRAPMLCNGFSLSLHNLIFAVFSWFVISVLEVFLGNPKATA